MFFFNKRINTNINTKQKAALMVHEILNTYVSKTFFFLERVTYLYTQTFTDNKAHTLTQKPTHAIKIRNFHSPSEGTTALPSKLYYKHTTPEKI